MAGAQEPNGKNSLVGEFLLALARAPEPIQEAIIIWGLKKMQPFSAELIAPYPMMNHMVQILRLDKGDDGSKKT
ncbi:MAG: hypothetical protein ABIR96_06710 [Bdellovibrionota bacterium]